VSVSASTKSRAPENRPPAGKLRRAFAIVRKLTLLFIFALLSLAIYLNQIGLPQFAQKRLREAVLARGWELDYTRVRLHSWRELAVEDFHLRRTSTSPPLTNQPVGSALAAGPEIYVGEAYCRFRPGALRRLKFELEALRLNDGYLLLPVADHDSGGNAPAPMATNGSTTELLKDTDHASHTTHRAHRRTTFRQISGELLVKSDDQWELRNFQAKWQPASTLGVNLQLMGVLTNSSLLRDWKFPKAPSDIRRSGRAFWSNILRAIESIEFTGQSGSALAPQLIGQFYGDAADPIDMEASVRFAAAAVSTPWGAGTDVRILARLSPPVRDNDIVLVDLNISADDAHTPWGKADHVQVHAQMEPSYPQLSTTNALFTIDARGVETRWTSAETANLKVRLTGCPTNANLLQTDITLRANHVDSTIQPFDTSTINHQPSTTQRWHGELVDLSGQAVHPEPKRLHLADTNLLLPDRIANISLCATGKVVNLSSCGVQIDSTAWQLRWDSPSLQLDTTSAVSGGDLNLALQTRTDTRDLRFQGSSSFDPHKIVPLLPAKTQQWLSRYSWSKPPLLVADGQLVLPEWTNRGPAWLSALLPSITLGAQLKVGAAEYRGVQVLEATSHLELTNFLFTMPDLLVTRPKGVIEAQYQADLRNSDFHWRLKGPVDITIAQPWLETDQQRKILSELAVTDPPRFEGDLWGNWHDFDRFGATGSLSASNIAFRGQTMDFAHTRFLYTNQILTLLEPIIKRQKEEGSAPGIQINIPRRKLYITNAFGNLDPHAVVRAIGRQATRALEPFIFDAPPTTRVSGVVDLRKKSYEDDLHFEVAGRGFHSKKFNLQQVSGKIDWVGKNVSFRELNGLLETGRATGEAHFDFSPKIGADFSFKVVIAEADLGEVREGFGKTNKVEGILSGELVVTSGNTSSNLNGWHGYGRVNVRDGLLWNIPMFGIFSPVLNALVPDMGNSRAREANATFTISNSVVHSKDVEVHATGMRMHFEGLFAFDGRVDARVEAELFRDFPGIGLLLSKVLWPVTKVFEYKVSGTLNQPKAEPVYVIPKLLFIPFLPFKTLRDIVVEEPTGGP
jgi:hypothetical protein